MRKEWTGWTQISEVKSIELDGSHVGDKGEWESRVTPVSGLSRCWLQGPFADPGKTGMGTSLGKIIITFPEFLFCLY